MTAPRGVTMPLLVAAMALVASATQAGDDALRQFDVRLEQRQVVDPPSRRLVVSRNAQVTIRWHSDEAGELHVHGYDITVDLDPRAAVITRFEARATGRFPVTSHGFATQAGHGHAALLWIEVHPE